MSHTIVERHLGVKHPQDNNLATLTGSVYRHAQTTRGASGFQHEFGAEPGSVFEEAHL
jgi:hypothetical protein